MLLSPSVSSTVGRFAVTDMFLYLLGILALYFLHRFCRERKTITDKADKCVFITGCDSGFGNLLARHLDAMGFVIIASCLTEKGEEQLKKACSDRLSTVHLDMRDPESVRKVAAFVKAKVGGKGLWGLVNNAGVSTPTGPCDWLTPEDYRTLLEVNLYGLINVTLNLLPLIKKARGRVVNVASILGRICLNGGPYTVSKFGVEGFNDSLRRDMAHFGVKVICIEPGFFKTNMADMSVIQRCFEKLNCWVRTIVETSAETQALSPAAVRAMLKKSEAFLDPDLMKVVSCMEKAICAVHPRTRYAAGWDAKLFWLPLSYMPTFISDYVLLNFGLKPKKSLCVLAAALCLATVWLLRDSLKIHGVRDKCVLVTGCDSGFGNHVARQLDQRGFRVIATCLTDKGCSDLQAAASPNLTTVLLNLTDSASLEHVVELVRSVTGGRGEGPARENGSFSLWGLVNNAGRSIPIGPTEWMNVEDFKKVLDVNLIGMIDLTLRLIPQVKKARGRIVNVASVMGRVALTGGGYALSKHGVESFSDSLRRDMRAFGVKVSIIEPGFFKTAVTSVDLIEADLLRLWNRLPEDVKDSYGDKYLENYVKAQRFAMNILCSKDVSKVTWCMEHALTSRHPRTRYTAGWDAKLVWLPLSYCPTFIADFVIGALFPVAEDNRMVDPNQVDVKST
ncbi:hypothetical protein GN956_G4480 [Arapaima gigas]